ncbi:MAG: hypothetical protein BWY85_01771 [Firmicutes bacterium ADurb.Bin506]|nr:MAG: hypothetical protein BWY85_01771 [Firmicutes bacterium ADurb.Bin506]
MVVLGVAALCDGLDAVVGEGVGVYRIPAETVVEYAGARFGPDSLLILLSGHCIARLG